MMVRFILENQPTDVDQLKPLITVAIGLMKRLPAQRNTSLNARSRHNALAFSCRIFVILTACSLTQKQFDLPEKVDFQGNLM
ncbi:Uncharacterised protein [Actinobacillus equuli]|nr:Uncharacterised protein [Actinobacillus equuli]